MRIPCVLGRLRTALTSRPPRTLSQGATTLKGPWSPELSSDGGDAQSLSLLLRLEPGGDHRRAVKSSRPQAGRANLRIAAFARAVPFASLSPSPLQPGRPLPRSLTLEAHLPPPPRCHGPRGRTGLLGALVPLPAAQRAAVTLLVTGQCGNWLHRWLRSQIETKALATALPPAGRGTSASRLPGPCVLSVKCRVRIGVSPRVCAP